MKTHKVTLKLSDRTAKHFKVEEGGSKWTVHRHKSGGWSSWERIGVTSSLDTAIALMKSDVGGSVVDTIIETD